MTVTGRFEIVGKAESTKKTVTHYRLACGLTVRIGETGVYCCMSCRSERCAHVRAVQRQLETKS